MAAVYPGSVKSFTNPNSGNNLNSPPHATQHADENDEITAIQTELGTNPKSIDQTVAAGASPTSVGNFLDMVANRIKAITGTTNWYDAPAATIAALFAKFATTSGAGGHVHDASSGNGPLVPNINGIPVAGTTPTDWQFLAYEAGTPTYAPRDFIETVVFRIDGGGSAISTGVKGDIHFDYDCEIMQVTLLADQSGSIVLDVWKDTYANFPATVADTITASAKPTITTATKSQDATLTGWTKQISAGEHLRINVDSAATITRLLVAIKVKRN